MSDTSEKVVLAGCATLATVGVILSSVNAAAIQQLKTSIASKKLIMSTIDIPSESLLNNNAWLFTDLNYNLHFFSKTKGDIILSNSSSSGGSFLNLDGTSVMYGTLNLGKNFIQNVLGLLLNEDSSPTIPLSTNSLQLYSQSRSLYSIDDVGTIKQYASIALLDSYLKLDGTTTMTGNLNVGNNLIQNTSGLILNTNASPAAPALTNALQIYSQTRNLYSIDDLGVVKQYASISSLSSYLKLDGTTAMTGNLNVGNNLIQNTSGLFLNSNASPTTPSLENSLQLYSQARNLYSIDDIGVVKQYASISSLGSYLKLDGTTTMTGNFNVGTNLIQNTAGLILNTNASPATPALTNALQVYSQARSLYSIDDLGTVNQYSYIPISVVCYSYNNIEVAQNTVTTTADGLYTDFTLANWQTNFNTNFILDTTNGDLTYIGPGRTFRVVLTLSVSAVSTGAIIAFSIRRNSSITGAGVAKYYVENSSRTSITVVKDDFLASGAVLRMTAAGIAAGGNPGSVTFNLYHATWSLLSVSNS